MDGRPYSAGRFAASLRRKLFRRACVNPNRVLPVLTCPAPAEHLGLIPPQNATSRHEYVTSFMRPAPVPNDDETDLEDDARVADPLSDDVLNLLNTTARVNREVFTELFRPIPSNLVTNWAAYEVSGPTPTWMPYTLAK